MDPVSRGFRVYKTVLQMLADRKYLITKEELALTREQFMELMQIEHDEMEVPRSRMCVTRRKIRDSLDQVLVYFSDSPKPNQKDVEKLVKSMEQSHSKRGIMVLLDKLSPMAKQMLDRIPDCIIEQFTETELLVNVTEHQLVPKHELLTPEEKEALLARYKLKTSQLPRIQLHDPVARYYGLQRGEVVKIARPSETAGRYITYRLVI